MIVIRNKRFQAENAPIAERFLIDKFIIAKLYGAASLLYKQNIFGNLKLLDYDFVGVYGYFSRQLVAQQL